MLEHRTLEGPWAVTSHPELDTLSSDSTNSFRAQLCLVNCRIEEVQKESHKPKKSMGRASLDDFLSDISGREVRGAQEALHGEVSGPVARTIKKMARPT
ncbi:hypothetical protein BHM03_00052049 [Ensete ventricosum]|nr:hypothetical protein BHM03_00052049 [Ensete ventricosum]